MANSKKFSELPVASSMNNGDLFAVAQEDSQAETGYTSKNATALVVGKKLNGEIEYATDLPSFPPGDQNPLDALEYLNSKINDLYPVDSASGSLVNFTTSLDLPLVALKTYIQAQGGGGTPSSPIPIVGVSEVNLTRAGKNLVIGTLSECQINSSGIIYAYSGYSLYYAPIKKGAIYNFTSDSNIWGYFTNIPQIGSTTYDGTRIQDSSKTFTAPIDGYVAFRTSSPYETPRPNRFRSIQSCPKAKPTSSRQRFPLPRLSHRLSSATRWERLLRSMSLPARCPSN